MAKAGQLYLVLGFSRIEREAMPVTSKNKNLKSFLNDNDVF